MKTQQTLLFLAYIRARLAPEPNRTIWRHEGDETQCPGNPAADEIHAKHMASTLEIPVSLARVFLEAEACTCKRLLVSIRGMGHAFNCETGRWQELGVHLPTQQSVNEFSATFDRYCDKPKKEL